MTGHSPGDWKLEDHSDLDFPLTPDIRDHRGKLVAMAFHAETHEETIANAHLIKAAPRLLKACEACIPLVSANCLAGDLLRAAIAFAKGGA